MYLKKKKTYRLIRLPAVHSTKGSNAKGLGDRQSLQAHFPDQSDVLPQPPSEKKWYTNDDDDEDDDDRW